MMQKWRPEDNFLFFHHVEQVSLPLTQLTSPDYVFFVSFKDLFYF